MLSAAFGNQPLEVTPELIPDDHDPIAATLGHLLGANAQHATQIPSVLHPEPLDGARFPPELHTSHRLEDALLQGSRHRRQVAVERNE